MTLLAQRWIRCSRESFISNRINAMGQAYFQAKCSLFNVVALLMKCSSSASENGLLSPFVVVIVVRMCFWFYMNVNSRCSLMALRINKESDTNQFYPQRVIFLYCFVTFYPKNLRTIICHKWEWFIFIIIFFYHLFFWFIQFWVSGPHPPFVSSVSGFKLETCCLILCENFRKRSLWGTAGLMKAYELCSAESIICSDVCVNEQPAAGASRLSFGVSLCVSI